MGRSKSKWTSVLLGLLLLTGCVKGVPLETHTPDSTTTPGPAQNVSLTRTITPTLANIPETKTVTWSELISPDGKRTAVVFVTTFTQPEAEEIELTVISRDGKHRQIVESIHFDRLVYLMDLPQRGHIYLKIVQWSVDGKSLYFSKAYPYGTPCSMSWLGQGGADLRKFDLDTGETTVLLDRLAIEMLFSPDKQTLLYTPGFNSQVVLYNVLTHEKTSLPLPDLADVNPGFELEKNTSGLLWSPDGRFAVYAVLKGICDAPIALSSVIMLIDTSNLSQEIILNEKDGFLPIKWENPNGILLQDNEDSYWWLNPTTKEITPAQP